MKTKKNIPSRLCGYGIDYVSEIGNVMANFSRHSKGRTPLEHIKGETPDISTWTLGFYNWVVYQQNAGVGPAELGRRLSVFHRTGRLMTYWILPISEIPTSCAMVQRLTQLDQETASWKQRMEEYDKAIGERISLDNHTAPLSDVRPGATLNALDNDPIFEEEFSRVISDSNVKDADDLDVGGPDHYINMELAMMRDSGEEPQYAMVKRRAVDRAGKPMGVANPRPLFDSRLYNVGFLDGTTKVIAANVIAENLLAQVDEERHRQIMIDKIIDHQKDGSFIPRSEGTYTTANGMIQKKITTRG